MSNNDNQKSEGQKVKQDLSTDELNILFMPLTFRNKFVTILLFIFLLLFLIWFFFGSIPVVIEGKGIVMNQKGLFNIQAKAPGIISQVYVHPGQNVKKGDLLIKMTDPEEESKYKASLIKVKTLETNVTELQKQIQIELAAQNEAILEQIKESKASIEELQKSIVELEDQLKIKQNLFNQHLIGLDELYGARQLLSQREIALETTKGTLESLQANLTKSYREEELLARERDLLQARQDTEIIKLGLHYLDVTSANDGTVLEVLANPGDYVIIGTVLMRLEYAEPGQQSYIFYVYIPSELGKKIELNTPVTIELSTVKAEEFGSIVGKVIAVSSYPVSKENIGNTIQNEGLVDYLLAGNKSAVQIIVEPEKDDQTYSKLKWTSGKGPDIKISTGTVATVKGLVGHISPAYYLFTLWTIENLPSDIRKLFEKKSQENT